MDKSSKIFVAGHRGLVGSAILKNLQQRGYTHFVLRTHAELDLTDQLAVNEFFAKEKPKLETFTILAFPPKQPSFNPAEQC